MKKTLKLFQLEGSKFLQEHAHALLADEPGLGKTLQVLDAAEKLKLTNVLIVCPASVRTNWWQEIHECGIPSTYWRVISYEQAVLRNASISPDAKWDGIILDESHYLKTVDSKRTQAIFGNGSGLARRATYKWCLSGSPCLNRPRELYPVLKTLWGKGLDPYDSYGKYAIRFCGGYFDGRSFNDRGASHLDDLKNRLDGFMLRRLKSDVMPELPNKIVSRVPLEISEQDKNIIEKVEHEIENREAFISSTMEEFSQLGDMAALLHAVGHAKVGASAVFIVELLETHEKVTVFAHHRDVIKALSQELSRRSVGSVTYQGGMSDGAKQEAINAFVGDPSVRVFIGNTMAAGTGINGLQLVSSSVVFAEIPWVPGQVGQAVDRCHRIGQKAESVNVYLLHVPGTIESAVLSVQNMKHKILDKLGLGLGWN